MKVGNVEVFYKTFNIFSLNQLQVDLINIVPFFKRKDKKYLVLNSIKSTLSKHHYKDISPNYIVGLTKKGLEALNKVIKGIINKY